VTCRLRPLQPQYPLDGYKAGLDVTVKKSSRLIGIESHASNSRLGSVGSATHVTAFGHIASANVPSWG
jgi:hypothetical protein